MGGNALSFVFRDRVLYPAGDAAARQRAEAVSAKMEAMARAYGHTLTADFAVSKYIEEKLRVEMRDAWGRVLGVLTAEADGFVLTLPAGILFYPGESTVLLAIRDDEPLVGPYPETFF